MPYVKYHSPWHDADAATGGGDESTPLTAAALDYIEAGIAAAIPADIIAAKGDLIVGTANDTPAIKTYPAADDYALASDTAQTTGVIWKKIGNAMIATNAAIDVSKLAPSSTANDVLTTVGGVAVWQAAAGGTISAVTALPGSPTDGQEVVLMDSLSAPTYRWHLRYNSGSASAYKWEFIGGTPKTAEVATSESTSSTTYVALTTPGPAIALPNAGDWLVEIGAEIDNGGQADISRMSYDIGGTGASDNDAIKLRGAQAVSAYRQKVQTGLTAVTLTAKYKVSANTHTFVFRFMAVTPIRIS